MAESDYKLKLGGVCSINLRPGGQKKRKKIEKKMQENEQKVISE